MVDMHLENEFTYPIYFYVFAEYTSIDKKQLRIDEQISRVIEECSPVGIFRALLFEESKERQRVKEKV